MDNKFTYKAKIGLWINHEDVLAGQIFESEEVIDERFAELIKTPVDGDEKEPEDGGESVDDNDYEDKTVITTQTLINPFVPYSTMKNAELTELIKQRGVKMPTPKNKETMIAALEEADKANEGADTEGDE